MRGFMNAAARWRPAMADRGLHHLPVTDGSGRLAGIVTQSDLIAALYRNCLDHRGGPENGALTTPSNPHQP